MFKTSTQRSSGNDSARESSAATQLENSPFDKQTLATLIELSKASQSQDESSVEQEPSDLEKQPSRISEENEEPDGLLPCQSDDFIYEDEEDPTESEEPNSEGGEGSTESDELKLKDEEDDSAEAEASKSGDGANETESAFSCMPSMCTF
jgi:hypothetical protein